MNRKNRFAALFIILAFNLGWGSPWLFSEEEKTSDYHLPEFFLKTLTDSDITYEVSSEKEVNGIDLTTIYQGDHFINPYLYLEKNKDGMLVLKDDIPNEKLKKILETPISELFQKKEYKKLEKHYLEAVKIDPNYFKNYTFLGNIYFLMEDYQKAKTCLTKAIELNPIDYQAHFFLADTLWQLNQRQDAKKYIIQAYMLNKSNQRVKKRLDTILKAFGLKIKTNRLYIPAVYQRINETKAKIIFKKDEMNWIGFMLCYTCWNMESEFLSKKKTPQDVEWEFRMYKECLINQLVAMERTAEQGKVVSAGEKFLKDVAASGYLDIMISWEIFSPRYPSIILLMPKEIKEKIIQYINKFVIVKADEVIERWNQEHPDDPVDKKSK